MISPSNLRGILCMVLCAFNFVANDSFLKLIVADVPPFQGLFLRGVVATIWCTALLGFMGQLRLAHLAFAPWTLARAMGELVGVTSFVVALAHVPLADISAIYQIAPLIVLAGASVIWREHIGTSRWFLIALGVTGALLVAQPGGVGSSPYALLGFITAIGSAGRDLMSRKVPDHAPGMVITLTIVVVVMVVAGLCNLLFEHWVPVNGKLVGYSLGAGFFLVFGQFFAFMAFRLATARAVAPFYYCITIFAVLFGAVLFNEFPNTLALAGIALIITCGLGVLLLEKRSPAVVPESAGV